MTEKTNNINTDKTNNLNNEENSVQTTELKAIFASKLIKLRRGRGLTQAELGEKLNYSDKSVSKWERGETLPDAYILKAISREFNVSVDSLLSPDDERQRPTRFDAGEKVSYNPLFIILCSVVGTFTLCLLEFLLVWAIVNRFHWIVLYAAVPLSLIELLIFNSIWYKSRRKRFIIAALTLSLILFAYLILLYFNYNFWQLLLIILPSEALVFLACSILKKKEKEKTLKKH